MSYYNELLEVAERLERENPRKTIILSANTLTEVLISDDAVELRKKVEELHANGDSPVILGGPHDRHEIGFHLIC